MSVLLEVLTPSLALAVTVATLLTVAFAARAKRARNYRRFEDKSAPILSEQFALPKIVPGSAEARCRSYSVFVHQAHQGANSVQTKYYVAVVGSAWCLALAFLVLAFDSIHLEDEHPSIAIFLNWIDTIAVIFVLLFYFYGRWASGVWIAARARTEFLRQYQYLDVVFPGAMSAMPTGDPKTQFEREADRVAMEVQDGNVADIVARIENFWAARKRSITGRDLTETDLTGDALIIYLQRRVRRQLGWFTDSQERLEYVAEQRNVWLPALYGCTAALAVIKLLSSRYAADLDVYLVPFLGSRWQAYLLALLLILTGMSASMTAYYINQNSRSLIHRYFTQRRFITVWLNGFNERWNFASLPSLTIGAAAKDAMRAEILRLEDLMIEELIDWTHITGHDAIELAP
jgi:hypothetical protein